MDKRNFLRTIGTLSAGAWLAPDLFAHAQATAPAVLAGQEPFWDRVRAQYRLTDDYINLESGYYSMQAEPVMEAFVRNARIVNLEHSHYMRTRAAAEKDRVRARLATLVGAPVEEVIITRNTTESLDTVIAGFDWKEGDEAVMATHDYGAMLDQFKLMARRYGIVNRLITLPLHPASDDEIVQLYANALTPRTRVLMICHVVNLTGQILPVRKVADMARARGVHVMVDGAHAVAQLEFKVPDLGADYYGASLHKWLGTPLGAGLLWVRRDRIAGLWPLFGDEAYAEDDIRRLNHTGTHPPHTDLTIDAAIDYHESIGAARKEARLRWLQQYWTSRVRGHPRITVNTPADPARSCAIANVAVAGMKPGDLAKRLMDEYRIWTVAIDRAAAGVHGVRVTPHLFTNTKELDQLVTALQAIAG